MNLKCYYIKKIVSININESKDEVIILCSDNSTYRMYHSQEYCESVYIDDICGDLDDILNSPILLAEKVSNRNSIIKEREQDELSFLWTFYKLSTIKGNVTIRWFGSSNGYYSEEVDFVKIN